MTRFQVEEPSAWTEAELIRRAVQKDETAVRAIIQANNRRLYRIARSIMRDDAEAEDVLQDAYLRAFSALAQFRGDSSLSTWLTRIVFNEALQRRRRRRDHLTDHLDTSPAAEAEIIAFPGHNPVDPERTMAQREIFRLLERAIDELPEEFRTVVVARVIEDMSIDETASLLNIRPETVKTRLHRARRLLKAALEDHLAPMLGDAFPFAGARCEAMTEKVVKRVCSEKN